MRINDESEDSLFLPVDGDIGGDVMTQRQLGGQLPLLLCKAIALAATVLTSTKHEKLLTLALHVQHACSRAHRVFTQRGDLG